MKFLRPLFMAVLSIAAPAFAAELPSGESLLQKSLDRSGGAAAFAKINNAVMTGTVDMVGHNLSGAMAVYQSGEKSYTVIELPGIGKIEEGFDGKTAWEMSALQGARIKDGEEQAAVKRASKITLLGSWRNYYKKARTLGSEDVDGKPAWKVELTPTEGKNPEFFYFDKETGLLSRVAMIVPTALGDIPADVSMSDYRVVDGIQTPFAMTQKAMSQVLAMHFDKVVYNDQIAPDRFDLPPAVKAIADKQKP
ncbi:MAG: hypothetical protein M3N54_01980 [Acidobacteriota bacterium]|nr:hypothetical protein [Acidobacteriota bacterium]